MVPQIRRFRAVSFALLGSVLLAVNSPAQRSSLPASPLAFCGVVQPRARLGAAASPEPISPFGVKTLIYFRVRFPDDQSDPISAEAAGQTLAEANQIFERTSRKQFSLDWTVSPVLQLSKSRDAYSGPSGFDSFLADVREAALAEGLNYLAYDLDVVRHSGVPGFMGGNANLGARGAQVQADGAVLLVHELGHNLGLSHANLWFTGNPGISLDSPPLPSNYPNLPEPRSIPVYPDSALGHETVTGPGQSLEYGDTSDIMGSGSLEFSAVYQHQLGWVQDGELAVAGPGLTTNRVVGTARLVTDGRPARALRVPATANLPVGEREYFVQVPPPNPDGLFVPGLEIRWSDVAPGRGSSLLLAPLTGRPGLNSGTVLPPGETFSDPAAGVHITLTSASDDGITNWADIVVFNGSNSGNRAPAIDLQASALKVQVDEPVLLTGTASDPDGDALVWRWDFGDGTSSLSSGRAEKSWRRVGDFVVIAQVTDLKGGVASRHVAVRVGTPGTQRISGRVLTPGGEPVFHARVHNGIAGGGREDGQNVTTYTDSLGRYTLVGLAPGTYTNGAYCFGYRIERRPPVHLADNDVTDLDFVAFPLPQVSVYGPARIAESSGLATVFTLKRTGPAMEPMTVFYQLGGTATSGWDYVRPLLDRAVIPAGKPSVDVALNILDDQAAEEDEAISLQVVAPTTEQREAADGSTYTAYYPGYDIARIDGQDFWVLNDPAYLPDEPSSATVLLADNDGPTAQLITAKLLLDGALELTLQGRAGDRLVLEASSTLHEWIPVRTNVLFNTNLTRLVFPRAPASPRFYRTVR